MLDAVFEAVLAAPDETFEAATLGFAFDSADTVVSPVDALSTGVEGAAVIADAVLVAESDAAAAVSLFAASLRAHAAARLSTLPMSTARPRVDRDGDTGSSKQRFIDMLITPVRCLDGGRSARGAYSRHVVFHQDLVYLRFLARQNVVDQGSELAIRAARANCHCVRER